MKSKIIQGYGRNKYEIFEDGTVISLGRIGARGYIVKDRVLKSHSNSNGYLRVPLNLTGKRKEYFIHRLVAECFVENLHNKDKVNHKDGNKHNNHYSNLEWVTSSENNKHAFALGLKNPTVHYGESSHFHKLTNEDVEYIKSVHKPWDKEFGSKPLAKQFNVNPQTITDIIHGRTWYND